VPGVEAHPRGDDAPARLRHQRVLPPQAFVQEIPRRDRKGVRIRTGVDLADREAAGGGGIDLGGRWIDERTGDETGVTRACFETTTTLGIRRQLVTRAILRRDEGSQATEAGDVRVKIARRPGGRTVKADSDDLDDSPTLATRRARRQAAEARTNGETDE